MTIGGISVPSGQINGAATPLRTTVEHLEDLKPVALGIAKGRIRAPPFACDRIAPHPCGDQPLPLALHVVNDEAQLHRVPVGGAQQLGVQNVAASNNSMITEPESNDAQFTKGTHGGPGSMSSVSKPSASRFICEDAVGEAADPTSAD
jgi:hypothetical protein